MTQAGGRIISDGVDAQVQTMLVVQTLAGMVFTVVGPHGTATLDITTKKNRALLAFIALSEGKFESRDRLASLLWPDVGMKNARHSLRMALMDIRKQFDAAGFTGYNFDRTEQITLDPQCLRVDIKEIQRALAEGHVHPRLLQQERIIDRLLEDCDGAGEDFGADVRARRGTWQQRFPLGLTKLMDNPAADKAVRLEAARALHLLEESNEKAVRMLMRAKVEEGDTNGALNLYNALYDLLDRVYQWAPEKETQELNADIKTGRIGPDRPDAPPPVPVLGLLQAASTPREERRVVIGVSQFNTTGLPEGQLRTIVEGFRGEIIGSLLKFREWYVRSNPAAPTDKADPSATGEYVIDASASQAGEQVRVVMMLREVATGQYIWNHKVMLSVTAWFEHQDRIIREIAMALGLYISAERLTRLRAGAGNIKAFDFCMAVQDDVISRDPVRWTKAEHALEAYVKDGEDFARIYMLLSNIKNTRHCVFPGIVRTPETVVRSIELARIALQLDPLDARCHLAMAYSFALSGQFDAAMAHFDTAKSVNESDLWVLVSASAGIAICSNRAGAQAVLREVEQTLLKAPFTSEAHWGYLATIHFLSGNYQEVVELAHKASGQIYMSMLKAAACSQLGQRAAAATAAADLFQRCRADWRGTPNPGVTQLSLWALSLLPLSNADQFACLRDGLHHAGGDCSHLELVIGPLCQ